MPKIQKVTDPGILRELARQGIDPNYVELFQDYAPRWRRRPDGTRYRVKERGPSARFYRDCLSGKRFMVASNSPMVKAEGHPIEVGWLYAKEKYYSKANLFSAIVEGKQVKLTVLSDQPNGAKKGDRVTYKPQLFIDGIEILNGSEPTLLPTDPTNPNYKENTLEWTYGTIAERRIRIIEGRYRDRHFILSHPHGRVSVKNNCIGNLKLKLGRAVDAAGNPLKVTVIGDEEIVEASEFDGAIFPVEIGASATYYPDTNSAGVDGFVDHYADQHGWDAVHDAAGNQAYYSDDYFVVQIKSYTPEPHYLSIERGILVIDESDLPPGAIVSATTFTVFGMNKGDGMSISPTLNVFSSNPANNTSLVAADYLYTKFGTSPYCDTDITYAGFNVGTPGSPNDFVFNANPGIVAVQAAADGDTVLKLGVREATYDAPDNPAIPPDWVGVRQSYLNPWATEKGAGYKPQVLITYEAAQTVTPSSVPTASSIQAPSVSGSGSSPITLSPVAVPSAVQAPSVSGSGSASIAPSPVAVPSAVQAPSVSGSGSAPVLLSPVQAVSWVNGVVSGTGIASIYPSPIITTSSVMVPVTTMTCRAPELEREVAELELALEPKAHFEV